MHIIYILPALGIKLGITDLNGVNINILIRALICDSVGEPTLRRVPPERTTVKGHCGELAILLLG